MCDVCVHGAFLVVSWYYGVWIYGIFGMSVRYVYVLCDVVLFEGGLVVVGLVWDVCSLVIIMDGWSVVICIECGPYVLGCVSYGSLLACSGIKLKGEGKLMLVWVGFLISGGNVA